MKAGFDLLVAFVLSVTLVSPLGATPGTPSAPKAPEKGPILTRLPDHIDAGGRYLIYLHGKIIEDEGVHPTSPQFGVYEYAKILKDLAAPGFTVISEPRTKGTPIYGYAEKVASQVKRLLAAGVPAQHITVTGFSKGGMIAMMASSMVQNPDVNYVFMASCGDWMRRVLGLRVSGRVLAIREASDDIGGPCKVAFDRAGKLGEHRELVLHLGGGHGAFYRPHKEWLDPLLKWAEGPAKAHS
ncbi:MAG: alpha/beta hydrolase [Acidobacteria bacterium]|jgi:hypothetical protein|nr:alpha/beta hydrolase [Acidobacteriota bacterium]